jgi:dipeptidyl aminopeptidase/acylaminoacyl peptidase
MHHAPFFVALFLITPPLSAQTGPSRPVTLADLNAWKDVSDPQISPDGGWVAYEVGQNDPAEDEHVSDLWMTSWDGQSTVRLTNTPKASETMPRWSPDGRWLTFLSSRGDKEEADQLWLLDRRGGEAEKITAVKAGVSDYVWSPTGTQLVLVIKDGDSVEVSDVVPAEAEGETSTKPSAGTPPDTAGRRTPPPIVIERYYFKEDYTGYVRRKRSHLYLYTLADRKLEQLTLGDFDELLPQWSPDGQYLVFVTKRASVDPDRGSNWDLWVIQATKGAVPRQLTTFTGPDGEPDWESRPAWGPNGRFIAYLRGGPDSLFYYAGQGLAVAAWGGNQDPTIVTQALDRNVSRPAWGRDGQYLYFRLEDDRAAYLARIPAQGGRVERVIAGRRVVQDFSIGPEDRIAALVESPDRPAEIYAVEPSRLRALTHQNDSLLALVRLAPVAEISVKSRDGTTVNGFLVRPVGYQQASRYPTVLDIHGGPVNQFENDFNFYWQLLAANGYTVVAMNPRGSSGRGEKYSLGIWADWGNKDAQDVLAGVDYAVKNGIADADRLAVSGWSYGGILTNYVIAQDTRFKAAVSGASISNILAGYGTDMYIREYEAELGKPWKNTATWIRLSFPFLHADRIRTPTLFLCGAKDFNVPLLNSEQMYQALRSLGVPTKLVIYPETYHGIGKPSYKLHRFDQYLKWFGEYLKP